jgi:hypothetical protein
MIVKPVRVLFAAILFATMSFAAPARATAFTTDQSDLWWDPAESGWGIQFVHRGSVMFATIFIYDQQVPIGTRQRHLCRNLVWTGDLYLTNGLVRGRVLQPRCRRSAQGRDD